LQIPAIGYGIRYEFGIFDQVIVDGWQQEVTDTWLRSGNPWELRRHDISMDVRIGGHTEQFTDEQGRLRVRWIPAEVIRGVAYDTPVPGYGVSNANLMRLWRAEAPLSFDLHAFNQGDYYGAVMQKVRSETVSKVLYPNDEPETGKRLRLIQQYFFVSCSLQDMIRIYTGDGNRLTGFHEKYVAQLNDTHPAIAVAELMRLLVDENHMDWEPAWEVTRRTFAYTNHTLLPEALEKWAVPLFREILPRLYEIVVEINHRFMDQVRMHYMHDTAVISRLSIIDEQGPKYVRMANLACVGSFAINGVAELHSRLLKDTVLKDFHDLWPEKFHNKTNGVTPRRFVMMSNPDLARLLDIVVGPSWVNDLTRLRELENYSRDPVFHDEWRRIKLLRKQELADYVRGQSGIEIDPNSLFDVQTKRIHEYKRQHLNVLNIVTQYLRIKRDPGIDIVPRTFVFGGKSAPGYSTAKLIIKLINSVAEMVNHDADVAGRLKVVFVPNLNIKTARHIYPAADLSEQISMAGKEASGTGNMKFSMNGALTIGTLDGANVEIRDEVGKDNFFLFGHTTEDIARLRNEGRNPGAILADNPMLREVIELIGDGFFSHGDGNLFQPLLRPMLERDEYFVLADYQSYIECQDRVSQAWRNSGHWSRMSILNVARMGKFSSDRTIREYNRDIWRVNEAPVNC
jgi:starch phosphorylase